jgi:hypothetical protein
MPIYISNSTAKALCSIFSIEKSRIQILLTGILTGKGNGYLIMDVLIGTFVAHEDARMISEGSATVIKIPISI